MALLECRGLTKTYGSQRALDSVNLALEKGKIVGLLGPNGSGKTTLIKLANGLIQPTEGQILINESKPSKATKAIVSYLPDRITLPEWMNTKQIVNYYADFYKDFSREKADRMIAELAIDENKPIKHLSKGTREKVQLIMTMSRDAQLYLLDEPIGGVDPATRDYILRTIISNYNPNSSVVISTHLISDVEKYLDEVIFLKEGQISLVSSVDDIREKKGMSVDQLFREVFKC